MKQSTQSALCAALLLLAGCSAVSAPPMPPPAQVVTVVSPVSYVLIPGTSIYYVDGMSPEVFFVAGNFYVQLDGAWHLSADHQGPWSNVSPGSLPKPLQGQSPTALKRRVPNERPR